MSKFLAYDLEIAKVLPDDDTDWKAHAPLGISCAATAWMRDGVAEIMTWHGIPQMTPEQCRDMVNDLIFASNIGYTLLTHNGTSFDWWVTAQESGLHAECVELAMNSVDTCLLMHCLRGFPVGLDAICKGMGIQGKTEGVSGEMAPILWQRGEYETVLRYVAQDAKCTLEVALEIEKQRVLSWVSKKGYIKTQIMPRLMPVREALQLPEPNVSWMDSPMPRSKFVQWMER